ncbi:MAG: hypothetical protein ACO3QC_07295, partial [Phycisphaerales bacterium]
MRATLALGHDHPPRLGDRPIPSWQRLAVACGSVVTHTESVMPTTDLAEHHTTLVAPPRADEILDLVDDVAGPVQSIEPEGTSRFVDSIPLEGRGHDRGELDAQVPVDDPAES